MRPVTNIAALLLLSIFFILKTTAQQLKTSFTINYPVIASAGVFQKDGTLVKTLWSGKKFVAGEFPVEWDGKSDLDSLVPNGEYEFRVTTNNISADWGVIGNTSMMNNGPSVHHSGGVFTSMAFVGKYAYYSVGYNEGYPSVYKIDRTNPQQKIEYQHGQGQVTVFEATDGINVYHAGFGHFPEQFVYATRITDDNQVIFQAGRSANTTYGQTYESGIDFVKSTVQSPNPDYQGGIDNSIGGLAVQRNGGKFLFISYFDIDEIHVMDVHTLVNGRPSGMLVRKITNLESPKAIALNPKNDKEIWIINNKKASKFSVNDDGSLSSAILNITNLSNPLSVTISPDGNTVAIADGGDRQQVRFFNNNSGLESNTLGQRGGYHEDPNVEDDKFMFRNTKEFYLPEETFVAYDEQGNLWLKDQGNQRIQEFNSNGKLVNSIMYQGYSYSAFADHNDPSRIFSNYLEFHVDYSKPLAPNNNSWKLIKNWANNVDLNYDNQFNRLRSVTTLKNGRTYALLAHKDPISNWRRWELVELPRSGNLRFTGIRLGTTSNVFDMALTMYSDGSIVRMSNYNDVGKPSQWIKRTLDGFDEKGNPTWGPDEVIASTPALGPLDPVNEAGLRENQITSTGKIIAHSPQPTPGFHLGSVSLGTNKWLWKTSLSTHKDYRGEFPADGTFDLGNDVNNNTGNFAMAADSIIVWGYHGENWKSRQTNKWNFYLDNGLFLFQCGLTGEEAVQISESAAGMAGNALSGSFVKLPHNELMLVHNDEGQHSAVHCWRIKNLNSIKTLIIPILKEGDPIIEEPGYIDLMKGLPFNDDLKDGTMGWSRLPKQESKMGPGLSVSTSKMTYKKNEKDLWIEARLSKDNLTMQVARDLGSFPTTNHWQITGEIAYPELDESGQNYFEILDRNQKVIIRISRPQINFPIMAVKSNNISLTEGDKDSIVPVIKKLQPLKIKYLNGKIFTTYANYPTVITECLDTSADAARPRTLRIIMSHTIAKQQVIDIANLKMHIYSISDRSYFQSKNSGDWNSVSTWIMSKDSVNWITPVIPPDTSADNIEIQATHCVTVSDSVKADQVIINKGGILKITPSGTLFVNNGFGNDIIINESGGLLIQSDSLSTGKIGYSTGTIQGEATIEKYINTNGKISNWLLGSMLNSEWGTRSYIVDNWQEGKQNHSLTDNNVSTKFGTFITGSITGENGFDKTADGEPSMFTSMSNPNSFQWKELANTNASCFNAQTGYLIKIQGDRTVNLSDNKSITNTILRATGRVATGVQIFQKVKYANTLYLVANPYAASINWQKIYNDLQTKNQSSLKKFYTYLDPKVGRCGGFVTVSSDGVNSLDRINDIEILAGNAFFIQTKATDHPSFTINESHKSNKVESRSITAQGFSDKINASLLIDEEQNNPVLADGVSIVFDNSYSDDIDDDDAMDIANLEENVSIKSNNEMLSIEGRHALHETDTIQLLTNDLRITKYSWRLTISGNYLSKSLLYLDDSYLKSRTQLISNDINNIPFYVDNDPASRASDRFKIVAETLHSLPVSIHSFKARKTSNAVELTWKITKEELAERLEIERSRDGRLFEKKYSTYVQTNANGELSGTWLDSSPEDGINYYRLKIVERTGDFIISKTVSTLADLFQTTVNVYPNPIRSNTCTVEIDKIPAGKYNISLSTVAGQTILQNNFSHNGGRLNKQLNWTKVSRESTYILKVVNSDRTFQRNTVVMTSK